MKTKDEIVKLAQNIHFISKLDGLDSNGCFNQYQGYINGYVQCQEDIVKELEEWIEITLSAESKLGASNNVIEALLSVKYKIKSLNRKD